MGISKEKILPHEGVSFCLNSKKKHAVESRTRLRKRTGF
jgi:hypothetical protein